LDLALEMEIVQKRGSWFSYNGNQLAQGRDAAKEILKNDDALYADIETKVKEQLEAKKEK
jgi:recombination protein RecA